MITVNNFFAHWVKEISIIKYGINRELPPTFSPWEVYQYSDQMLKHLPADDLKTIFYSIKNQYTMLIQPTKGEI